MANEFGTNSEEEGSDVTDYCVHLCVCFMTEP